MGGVGGKCVGGFFQPIFFAETHFGFDVGRSEEQPLLQGWMNC